MKSRINIETGKIRFAAAPELYGLFFEDINRAADGGLYPEMIRNRAFEDSLVPEGCRVDENRKIYISGHGWPGAFNHGEGMDEWAEAVPETDIPGWYAKEAVMELDESHTLHPNRRASLLVSFREGGKIYNIGYAGISVEQGEDYHFYMMLCSDSDCQLTLTLEDEEGRNLGSTSLYVTAFEEYRRMDCRLRALQTGHRCRFCISAGNACRLRIGFTSLMPEKTFMGHGLREDLALALKNTHSRFLRFPGGCVVEGINAQNAFRFSHMIGPVWERPGEQLMWHYRATNGLGFHEYLQLCEDLDMEALYVCNCGMDCQARSGSGLTEDETEEFLQEALHALEYALGTVDTEYGAMRAEAGHPEPFRLKYVEIGNENWGPEYRTRYERFYRVLREAWPEVILISNCHTEQWGLPTEFADEHYYNTPEFFLEHADMFDERSRSGPRVFLGEYAVNGGNTMASMECALAEAAFLTGVEKNQDLVRLTAYAPLFQNADYTAWRPNLIVFDNHRVYGIPSYHAISLMAKYRGEYVVECGVETQKRPPVFSGLPGIMCADEGLVFRNVKINGKPAPLSRMLYGEAVPEGDTFRMEYGSRSHHFTGKSREWNEAFETFFTQGPFREPSVIWGLFGEDATTEYTFEAELKFAPDNPVTFSIWNSCPDTDAGCNEPRDPEWNLRTVRNRVWRLEGGRSYTQPARTGETKEGEEAGKETGLDYSVFNHFRITAGKEGYDCYINGKLTESVRLTCYPSVFAAASADEEQIILKVVSVADEDQELEITLDCSVADETQTEVLCADPGACNSFVEPNRVSCRPGEAARGCGPVYYHLPAHSVNVLRMRRNG